MSGEQSWKDIVEDLAGPEKRPVVYMFSNNQDLADQKKSIPGRPKRKQPDGVFVENKIHGAYTTPV